MRFVITRREALDLADGINCFIFTLSKALFRQGHDVFLISASSSSTQLIANYYGGPTFSVIHCLSENPTPSHLEMLWAWRHVGLRLLRRIDPHFVIVNGALPFRLPYATCTVSHDLQRRWSYGSLVRRAYKAYAYRRTDRIVATCSELRDGLAAELAVPPRRISVIPTCIDRNAYQMVPLERRERAILHLGTAGYKAPLATMEAFARTSDSAKLYITGRPTQAMVDYVGGLPEEIRRRISFLGIIGAEELKRLLATVRVVSVPSIYSVPVLSPTVLESLASGTPVVGSTSISADVLDDSCGFRIDPADTTEMAAKLDLLLNDDPTWRAASLGALNRVAAFDSGAVAARYQKLAEEVGRKLEVCSAAEG